jgi:hypothetical protein
LVDVVGKGIQAGWCLKCMGQAGDRRRGGFRGNRKGMTAAIRNPG